MDPRVERGIERFVAGEFEVFGTPRKNVGKGTESTPLTPTDSYSFCSFCVHLAVNSYNIAVNGYGDAVTEGYSERGFDGIAISLNDSPLDRPETAKIAAENAIAEYKEEKLSGEPGQLPVVKILMIQVKMQGKAKTTDIDALGSSAYRFISLSNYLTKMTPNEFVERWWHIFDEIRKVHLQHGHPFEPELDLLFIYQGDNAEEDQLNGVACEAQEKILSDYLKHDRVTFATWRVDEILEAIRLAEQSVDGVLKGAQLLPLPKTSKAPGYIGYVPAKSISEMIPQVKFLGDKRGRPDERVFADNVRSFTGDNKNPGAVALRKTLKDQEADQVILRHNGITIVARRATVTEVPGNGGMDVNLTGYQIVNGAQSAFILQRNCDLLDGAFIPIKIVVTEDEAVKTGVVLGANLQSQINQHDMMSRKSEIRALQQAFESVDYSRVDKLWFQRRRGERFPNRVHHIFQILTPRQLLEAYVAAIEGMPHSIHANATKLLDRVPEKVFNREHHPSVYRAMGWLVVTGRRWAQSAGYGWLVEGSSGILEVNAGKNLYVPRHHFVFALWRLVDPEPENLHLQEGRLTRRSDSVGKRFEKVCQILSDPDKAIEYGKRVAQAIEIAREKSGPIGSQVRRLPFTERLLETIKKV